MPGVDAGMSGAEDDDSEIDLDLLADKLVERILPALLQALAVPKAAKQKSPQVAGEVKPKQKLLLSPAEHAAKAAYWIQKRGLNG